MTLANMLKAWDRMLINCIENSYRIYSGESIYKENDTSTESSLSSDEAIEVEGSDEGTSSEASGSGNTQIVYNVELQEVEDKLANMIENQSYIASQISGINLFMGCIVGTMLIKGLFDRIRS